MGKNTYQPRQSSFSQVPARGRSRHLLPTAPMAPLGGSPMGALGFDFEALELLGGSPMGALGFDFDALEHVEATKAGEIDVSRPKLSRSDHLMALVSRSVIMC